MSNLFDCPKCGKEVDADVESNQVQKKISYKCPSCNHMTFKRDALKLMEKRDRKRRWSIANCLEDGIDPFTGKKFKEK